MRLPRSPFGVLSYCASALLYFCPARRPYRPSAVPPSRLPIPLLSSRPVVLFYSCSSGLLPYPLAVLPVASTVALLPSCPYALPPCRPPALPSCCPSVLPLSCPFSLASICPLVLLYPYRSVLLPRCAVMRLCAPPAVSPPIRTSSRYPHRRSRRFPSCPAALLYVCALALLPSRAAVSARTVPPSARRFGRWALPTPAIRRQPWADQPGASAHASGGLARRELAASEQGERLGRAPIPMAPDPSDGRAIRPNPPYPRLLLLLPARTSALLPCCAIALHGGRLVLGSSSRLYALLPFRRSVRTPCCSSTRLPRRTSVRIPAAPLVSPRDLRSRSRYRARRPDDAPLRSRRRPAQHLWPRRGRPPLRAPPPSAPGRR